MGVQSYIELSTLLIGWHYYGKLWELLTMTGLIYLPFVMLLVKNFFDPLRGQSSEGASEQSLRKMLLDIFSVTLFYLICAVPMHTVQPHAVSYKPVCTGKPAVVAGQTGTTYDAAFSLPHEVKIPTFWYFVLSASNGITYAAKHAIDCPENIRGMNIELQGALIEDPVLRQDVQDFTSQCYKPAWTKYLTEKPSTGLFQKNDPQWIGSHFFLQTKGYYDTFRSQRQVEGFAYDESHDFELGENAIWGAPLCSDWWETSRHGIYERLSESLPTSWIDKLNKDSAIKSLVNTTQLTYQNDSYLSSQQKGDGIFQKIGATVGVLWSSTSFYPKIHLLKQSLPIVQSVLLFLIYIILPFAHVYGGYRFKTTFMLAFLVFGIVFWSFLWEVANVLDNSIIVAWFGEGTVEDKSDAYYLLANMIASLAYVGFPMIWIIIMGIVGKRTLGMMAIIHQGSGPASSAGASAGGLVGAAASMGIGAGRGAIASSMAKQGQSEIFSKMSYGQQLNAKNQGRGP